jgi:hypothetical protein
VRRGSGEKEPIVSSLRARISSVAETWIKLQVLAMSLRSGASEKEERRGRKEGRPWLVVSRRYSESPEVC